MHTKEPIIKNKEILDKEIQLHLLFPRDFFYFLGHFPDFPVLPAVFQSDFVMKCSKKHLGIDTTTIDSIQKLRFFYIIQPNIDIFLLIKHNKKQLRFKYFADNKVYSSGIFVVR